jgi:UDP-N-acetylmuramoylalanine--D-glutamate ligase
MEIAWFLRACPGPIAGVTGTRGKSTTTVLLHAILERAGLRPLLGGNLGGIETLSLLPAITPDRWTVLELGNWMLEGLHPIRRSPHLAIFTNLLPDHLNSYASMADYGEAKTAIYRYQRPNDIAIFNHDNAYTRRYGAGAPSEHVWFYSPERGIAWPRGREGDAIPFAYDAEIRLRGAHNLGNVQAAALAAAQIGIAPEAIRAAVGDFQGVPHRLEVVRVLDGVTYVNDSASTAPVAGLAALRSFAEPIVLIAGGNSKNLDSAEYADASAARCKRVVLLAGNASDAFAAEVRAAAARQGSADPVEGPYDDLAAAVGAARAAAVPGDVVLLSPGFTSFGLFLHEFDRGDRFRALVQGL